jgi:hypothetical protein
MDTVPVLAPKTVPVTREEVAAALQRDVDRDVAEFRAQRMQRVQAQMDMYERTLGKFVNAFVVYAHSGAWATPLTVVVAESRDARAAPTVVLTPVQQWAVERFVREVQERGYAARVDTKTEHVCTSMNYDAQERWEYISTCSIVVTRQ